jgi:hypothetical protein
MVVQIASSSPVRIARPVRAASPERWQKAAARALAERIEVRQIATTGQWVASSGTQKSVCYLMEVVAGAVRSCSCPAGMFGDPCCKHAARFYLDAGLLDPEPPTPAAPEPACAVCGGKGYLPDPDGTRRPERCVCPAGVIRRPAA